MAILCFLFAGSLAYDFAEVPSFVQSAAAEENASGEEPGAHDDEHQAEHSNPVTPVLLAIVMILFFAKAGGELFERLGMPAVLGELVVGIVLGNFALLTGSEALNPYFEIPEELPESIVTKVVNQHEHENHKKAGGDASAPDDNASAPESEDHDSKITAHDLEAVYYNPAAILKILAGIGVVLLLFEVGLESTVREMMSVGTSSLFVAILGVVAPMGLGWGGCWLLFNDLGNETHMFIGATLCATSVGITARVLKDLGRSKQRESQIILGAAVIDDVLGLVILTVVSGIIVSKGKGVDFGAMSVVIVIAKAIAFLAAAIVLGTVVFTRPLFKIACYLRGHGLLVATSLVICFGFAWLATLAELEPIVGAFAAGLILEQAHYRELGEKENRELEDALAPLTALLVPIFFVQMGTQVNLASFANSSVWGLAAMITVIAIIGKQVCAFGVREPGLNKMAVGLGMIPRGEVGLIFAGVGASLTMNKQPVIDTDTFSAVVVMVMITTMVTPPVLKWSLTRQAPEAAT